MAATFPSFKNMCGNDAQITAGIASIHKRGAKLALDIHLVLNAIAVRWAQTGDCRVPITQINHLLEDGTLTGVRKNAIKAWVEGKLGLRYVEDGDTAGSLYAPRGMKSGKHLDLKDCGNTKWDHYTPEKAYKPIDDPVALVQNLIKKLSNDQTKLGEKSKVSAAMVSAMNDAVTSMKAAPDAVAEKLAA